VWWICTPAAHIHHTLRSQRADPTSPWAYSVTPSTRSLPTTAPVPVAVAVYIFEVGIVVTIQAFVWQDLLADGKPIYHHVADRVAEWAGPNLGESGYSLVGAVVGATAPEQLAELRARLPGILFLVPGYGHQGGTAQDVAAAFDENGLGALVNNSRGITYAYSRPAARARFGDRWQAAIEQAVRDMSDDLAANTTTSRLKST